MTFNRRQTVTRTIQLGALFVGVPLVVVLADRWWHPTVPSAPQLIGSPQAAAADSSAVSDVGVALRNDSPDLIEWSVQLNNELSNLPAGSTPARRGELLMLLGDVRLALGETADAKAAYEEVRRLRGEDDHWQSRDAFARLQDADHLQSRTRVDRALWRTAFDQQRLAERLQAQGRFQDAVVAADRALQIRHDFWGSDHRETVESLMRLGWLYTEHAEFYRRSPEALRHAREECEQVYGISHPRTGDSLYLLATLADERGAFDESDALYEQALQVYRDTVGELSRPFARALNRQGRMFNDWWKDFAQGKNYRALQIREQLLGRDHPDCAESLEDLAAAAIGLMDFARAEKPLRRSIDIRQWSQGVDHPDLAQPECLLGMCLMEQGDAAQAYIKLRRSLDRTERARGAGHPITIRQRLCMGMQYNGNIDMAESYRCLEEVATDLRAFGLQQHPLYAEALFRQGDCLEQELGFRHDDSDVGLAQQILIKQTAATEACRSMPGGKALPVYAYALTSLHDAYYMQDYRGTTREDAKAIIDEALRVTEENGGVYNPVYRWVFFQYGRFWMSQARYDEAQANFDRFEELTRMQYSPAAHPWRYAAALRPLAGLHLHRGSDPELVYRYGRELDRIMQDYFRSNAAGQSDSSRLAVLEAAYFNLCANLTAADIRGEQAKFYDSVLAIRGAATSFQAADRIAQDHVELAPALGAAKEARADLKAVVLGLRQAEPRESWLRHVRAASDRKELAENELALAARPFVAPADPMTWTQLQALLPRDSAFIDFVDYAHHAPPRDGLGHLVKTRRILAFVLTPEGAPRCVPLGETAPIQLAVERWRQTILDFQSGKPSDFEAATAELSRRIWEPLAPLVSDSTTLFIAPVGPLGCVSFAALPGRTSGNTLLHEHRVDYVGSGQMLYGVLRGSDSSSGKGFLLAGGITYHAPELVAAIPQARAAGNQPALLPQPGAWENLEASGLEVEQIAGLIRGVDGPTSRTMILSGKDADVPHFTAALNDHWRCLHFAGHGFFGDSAAIPGLSGRYFETDDRGGDLLLRNQRLLSGIVLAPDREHAGASPILTTEDVGGLDLRGVDLVVLSACETGLGDTAGGEGVLGLTRAFRTSGVRTVVSSLWKVDDEATSLLMEQFYRNLLERKLSKSESLRQAQLTLLTASAEQLDSRLKLLVERGYSPRGIKTGVTRYVGEPSRTQSKTLHPALWAAFILTGDGNQHL